MSSIPAAPPPMIPPRSTNDARAAFFRAIAAPETVQRAPAQTPAVAQQPAAPITQAQAQAANAAPSRMLRPGSLLDIKV